MAQRTELTQYKAAESDWAYYQALGFARAAETGAHIVGAELSQKKARIDRSTEWVKKMHKIVAAEMRARGLPVRAYIVGKMRYLVKVAYIDGRDVALAQARVLLGRHYPIFEKYLDQWLTEYEQIVS